MAVGLPLGALENSLQNMTSQVDCLSTFALMDRVSASRVHLSSPQALRREGVICLLSRDTHRPYVATISKPGRGGETVD